MRIFLTGANGYIGGAVATALVEEGHAVRGLVRTPEKAALVAKKDIEPIVGSLDDADLLMREARAADAVINAADSDHRGAIEALVAGLAGSGKVLLHTSGSSVVSDEAMGEPADRIFHEGTPFEPLPDKVVRVAIDQLVLAAPGVRSAVLCNTMIYGGRTGDRKTREARASVYVGRGLNRWSNAYIDDVAALYALAVRGIEAGSFLYVETGEAALGDLVAAMARRLGLAPPRSLAAAEAIALLGREVAVFTLGSNSRVRGTLGRLLGWEPKGPSIFEWIEASGA